MPGSRPASPPRFGAPSPAIRTLRVELAGLSALEAALEGDMREPFQAALDLIAQGRRGG